MNPEKRAHTQTLGWVQISSGGGGGKKKAKGWGSESLAYLSKPRENLFLGGYPRMCAGISQSSGISEPVVRGTCGLHLDSRGFRISVVSVISCYAVADQEEACCAQCQ